MREPGSTLPSTVQVLSDAAAQVIRLIGKEAQLARAEIADNVSRAGTALALLVAGVVFGLVALGAIAAAGIIGLTEAGLHVGWAALIVGGGLAALAAGLIAKGAHDLDPDRLVPHRTVENVKRDMAMLRERFDGQA
jgi:hypothetical protein